MKKLRIGTSLSDLISESVLRMKHGLYYYGSRRIHVRIEENPRQFPIVYRYARRALLSRFPFAIYFRLVGDIALVIAVMDLRRKASRWRRRI